MTQFSVDRFSRFSFSITCKARIGWGNELVVVIIVPPTISPFYVASALHVGDRASLTCAVTKGDLPLTITWTKDGRVVTTGNSITIKPVDHFTSILGIDSLSPEHNGNYSCVVQNAAAQVSHTQQLAVNGNSALDAAGLMINMPDKTSLSCPVFSYLVGFCVTYIDFTFLLVLL